MAAYVSNVVIDAGADFNQTFNLEDSSNAPLNLTGYTGASKLKKHPRSLGTTATFSVSFPDRTAGQVKISLASSTTAGIKPGRYCYDVLVSSASSIKTRIVEGSAIVTAGVTTTIS